MLITVDCLRADHMSCYQYKRNTTPFLDSLATKSMFFQNAFANGPNTRHSVPSFLTSTYPLLFLQEAKGGRLHNGRKTLAEILHEKGYTTGGIHSNPYISKFYGYNRGFDYFNDFLIGQVEDDIKRGTLRKKIGEVVKGFNSVIRHKLPHETGERLNDEAGQWLEQTQQPFFLWLHYMDVHMPYVPPNTYLDELELKRYRHTRKIWLGKKIDDIQLREQIKEEEITDYINLYDGCIRYTDSILKELISKIEQQHPDTLFIITADHGEEFREHGGLSHLEKLYDELLHVPLILYGKNLKRNSVEKPVSLLGLLPTVVQLLNIESNQWFQGNTFTESDGYIIAEAWKDGRITAYRDNEWKLIINPSGKELYHLTEDKEEKHNVYTDRKNPEKIKQFETIIHHHIKMIEEERRKRETWVHREKIKKVAKKISL